MPAEKTRSFCPCSRDLNRRGKGLIVSARKSKALFYRHFIHNPQESVTPNKYMLFIFCVNQVTWQFKLNIFEIYALINVPDHFKQLIIFHDSLHLAFKSNYPLNSQYFGYPLAVIYPQYVIIYVKERVHSQL
jgi:hypothetical protein